MDTKLEELAGDRVRLTVGVPTHDLKHAVEHAASDLAASLRIPGFRRGKVPMPVLISRVGKERILEEAVESHIGGWFRRAAAETRIRPVEQAEYDYELPDSSDAPFQFAATVAVQPRVDVVEWQGLEVPGRDAEVPTEAVDAELGRLREAVAELNPVSGRPAQDGDVVVIDLVAGSGEARRDVVVELGGGRLVDELEAGIAGMAVGETKDLSYPVGDEGETQTVTVTLNDVKEKVLPALDDDLAKATSEFDTIGELRASIESELRQQLQTVIEDEFRAAAIDTLAHASKVQLADGLVRARAATLIQNFLHSLERRGIAIETYLGVTGRTAESIQTEFAAEAAQSLARELTLEAAADRLAIEVSDDEVRAYLREQAVAGEEEDPDAVVEEIMQSDHVDDLREDLRLKNTLDRIVSEVKKIPLDLAAAREKLWTPDKGAEEKENAPEPAKLWTPGQKEPE